MKYATGTAGVDYNANSAYVNDTYIGSTATTSFSVQEEPIGAVIDSYPLPTEYWTRPIYGENTIWFPVSSNWLGKHQAMVALLAPLTTVVTAKCSTQPTQLAH